MKTIIYISTLFITLSFNNNLYAQETEIEVEARPVGGLERYLEWLDQTIVYSDSAYLANIRGTLKAQFMVERNGDLTAIRVVDTLGFHVEESLREAIAISQPWRPGMNNGIPVRTKYELLVPINVRRTMGRRAQSLDGFEVAKVDAVPVYEQDDRIADSVGIIAEPPGGLRAFMQWIGQNYVYPNDAVQHGVNGTVLIEFIVGLDGRLSDIKVLNDLGHGTGEEAVRILKKSRPWKPAILDGRPVRIRFKLPIILQVN